MALGFPGKPMLRLMKPALDYNRFSPITLNMSSYIWERDYWSIPTLRIASSLTMGIVTASFEKNTTTKMND